MGNRRSVSGPLALYWRTTISVAAGAVKALIFAAGKYSIRMWAMGYFVKCLPGLIIQLVLVPSIIVALMKAHLVPERYPSRVKAASVEADE